MLSYTVFSPYFSSRFYVFKCVYIIFLCYACDWHAFDRRQTYLLTYPCICCIFCTLLFNLVEVISSSSKRRNFVLYCCQNGNNVEATFDFVEVTFNIVGKNRSTCTEATLSNAVVAFDNVASRFKVLMLPSLRAPLCLWLETISKSSSLSRILSKWAWHQET